MECPGTTTTVKSQLPTRRRLRQRTKGLHLVLFSDGSAMPNPGVQGCAYVLKDLPGNTLEARGYHLGLGSCNVAEYGGLLRGIEAAIRRGATRLDAYCDSVLVVRQVERRWKCKADHLRILRDRALELLSDIPMWSIDWIPRQNNTEADALANLAARRRERVDAVASV
jgi:ribonuclease HI